jgi:superfamily I DNA/RNA helicase
MSKLQEARTCSRKAKLQTEFKNSSNKYFVLSKIINSVLDVINISDDNSTINDKIEKAFAPYEDKFSHEFEYQANLESLKKCFVRWLNWEKNEGSKIVKRNFTKVVNVPGIKDSIPVNANLLIDRGDKYHIVRVKRGKPKLSLRGRTISTNPKENIDLFLLQLSGETLGLSKPVVPAFYYLKNKNDTSSKFNLKFDEKRGGNIITTFFEDGEKRIMSNIIKKVEIDISKRTLESNCGNCTYDLICNTNFVKREKPEKSEVDKKKFSLIKATKEQEQLIKSKKGFFRVNAVAGSGKTTIIALRTLALLEEGFNPKDILMITFTDKAKREMIDKINGYNEVFYEGFDLEVDKINIETFNSWGHKIISDNHKTLGFTKKPEVVDDLVKRDIITKLLEENKKLPLNYENPFLDLPYAKGAVVEMAKIIDSLKAADVKYKKDVEDVLINSRNTRWNGHVEDVLKIYTEYNLQLLKNNVVDYEDQLRLLKKLEPYNIFSKLTYSHVIIDEFQDSNPNQIDLIEKMVKSNSSLDSLVVVGDVMQAIYGFRNTSPENLLEFSDKFKNVKDVDLKQNFRSKKGIIDWANKIIKKESKNPHLMKSSFTGTRKPTLLTYKKKNDRVELLIDQITEWIVEGVSPESITILGRTKNELLKYQEALLENGYDSILTVPEIVKDNPYVQSIFSLAKYLNNKEDFKSLSYYAKSIEKDPFNMKEVLKVAEELKKELFSEKDEKEKLEKLFEKIKELSKKDYVAEYFYNKLENKNFATLKQAINYIVKYEKYGVRESFSTGLDQTEAINLITVHSSKGLEYDNVILMTEKFKRSAEEKRLFYVAITRAKQNLSIIVNEKQNDLIDLIRL